jgi:PAS domain S-box-containing protein
VAAGADPGGAWEGFGMSAAAARDEILLAFDVLKTPDATLSVAMNRRIVACNDAAERLFGYPAKELVGALFCDIVGMCHTNSQSACHLRCAALGNARRGRPTPDFEMSIVAHGGRVKWIHVTTLLARSASGHKRVVHLMRDVTALHQLDETRARSIAHTRQAAATPTAERMNLAALASAPLPPNQLTPRELDVLRLLACGLTTDEIAATFSISPVTARNHITKTMEKLGAATRLQAVVIASQTGLI